MAAGASRGNLGSLTVAIGANTEGLTQVINEIKKTNTAIRSLGTRISNQSKKIEESFGKAAKATKRLRTETDKATASTKKQETLLAKEIKTIASAEERTKNLTAAIKRAGASENEIKKLNAVTRVFRSEIKSAQGNTLGFANAQIKLSRNINNARRRLAAFNSTVRKADLKAQAKSAELFKDKMQDLTKSIQLALGPLSGVASRVTAFAGLVNKNTIAIAGLIGVVVLLGFTLIKAIRSGTAFEVQFKRIEAQLKLTGREAEISAERVNAIAEEVADATLTSGKLARQAASAVLVFTRVTAKDFGRVLNLAQDFASILGGDMVQAAKRIGRAIQDPNEGLSSLNRQLALLTPNEEAVAKGLSRMGREAEATAFILGILEDKIGGLARKEAKGLAGAFDTLAERIGRFLERAAITGGILQPLTDGFNKVSRALKRINDEFDPAVRSAGAFAFTVEQLTRVIVALVLNFDSFLIILGVLFGGKGIAFLGKAFIGLAASIRTATVAATLFNFAIKTGPLILLGVAIAAVTTKFRLFGDELESFDKKSDLLDTIKSLRPEVRSLGRDLDKLRSRSESFTDLGGSTEIAILERNFLNKKRILRRAEADLERFNRREAELAKKAAKAKEAADAKRFAGTVDARTQGLLLETTNQIFILNRQVRESDKVFFEFLKTIGEVEIKVGESGVAFEFQKKKIQETLPLIERQREALRQAFLDKQKFAFEEKQFTDRLNSALARIETPEDNLVSLRRELVDLAQAFGREIIGIEEFSEAVDGVNVAIQNFTDDRAAALAADDVAEFARKMKLANEVVSDSRDIFGGTNAALAEFNKQLVQIEQLRDEGFIGQDTFNEKLKKMEIQLARDTEGVQQFASTVSSGFATGILQGEKLSDVLGRIGDRLAEAALQALIFRSIMSGFGGFLSPDTGIGTTAGAATGSDISSAPGDFNLTSPTGLSAPPPTRALVGRNRGSTTIINIDAREADPGVEARVARAIARSGIQNRAVSANNSFEARRRA